MAPDFKSYLATQIVAEKQTVSYRTLSRAVKVHVNAAKCMLYEFHERENRKKPGSVYATYLIAGNKRTTQITHDQNGTTNDVDEDAAIPSSPPPFTSSMLEPSQQSNNEQEHPAPISIKTISLVREESLKETQQQYENITSIHVYSLSPSRLQDLVTLTDIGRDLYATVFMKQDPLIHNKDYGIIQNPEVRRRKGKRPIIPDGPAPKFQATKKEVKAEQEPSSKDIKATAPTATTKEDSRPSSRDSTSTKSGKLPSLKRDGSSLFKAFAKQSTQPKLARQDTDASTNASASGAEDVKMTEADEEGESEDEALFLDTNTRKSSSKKRPSDVKKERDDKAAKLRKMMDSDDEEEKALPNVEDATGVRDAPPAAEPGEGGADAEKDDVDWSESDGEKKQEEKAAEEIPAGPKRRRGKRKVMKKRTMKDEDGYLVTKEEAVWESFSEDEPDPPTEKPKNVFSSLKSQASQKSTTSAKGSTAKKGGNIMNFFGKK